MADANRRPALDLDKWRAGSDLDRAAWTLLGYERLLVQMRQTVELCRRDFYEPANPEDWRVPDLERRLAGVEAALNAPHYSHENAVTAIAGFLEAIPREMRSAA